MRDYMDKRVTPPKRVTSPTWGPPPPCKQALTQNGLLPLVSELFPHARLDATDSRQTSREAFRADHQKDLTETGNCAWKVSLGRERLPYYKPSMKLIFTGSERGVLIPHSRSLFSRQSRIPNFPNENRFLSQYCTLCQDFGESRFRVSVKSCIP